MRTLEIFVTWYYLHIVGNLITSTKDRFMFYMYKTNTIHMFRTLRTPLYGDNSSMGKYLGMFIKFWWSGLGMIYCFLRIMPRIIWVILIIFLPFIPIAQFINLLL
jgi:hypothetical protein